MIAGLVAWGTLAAAQETAILAERDPLGGVRLLWLRAGGLVPMPGDLQGTEWRRLGLRGISPQDPAGDGSVREAGGDLPRIQVRADFQIIACSSLAGDSSGIVSLSSAGEELLFSGAGERYRPLSGGAVVSPGGRLLTIAVKGLEAEEVLLMDISGGFPVAGRVKVPDPYKSIEPRSLALTRSALFFGVQGKDGRWSVYRAPAGALSVTGTIPAERIGGPFEALSPSLASSGGAVAFLAGSKMDLLEVFVARGSGPAENVTRSPGPYLAHSPEAPRLAISEDGLSVAYNLVEAEAEVFLHSTKEAGTSGRKDITVDERFNPYIIQESVIFFTTSSQLIFAGGHDPVTADLFRTASTAGAGLDVINMTRTGSGLLPPYLTKGTLTIQGALQVNPDSILVAATGFPGTGGPGLLLVSSQTGETLFEAPGLQGASQFFTVGTDLYFLATKASGERALFLLRASALVELGASPVGSSPSILLRTPTRAFVALPGTGILDLRPYAAPRIIASGGSFAPAAVLSPDGTRLVFGRGDPGNYSYFTLDLSTGIETSLPGAGLAGEVLALGGNPAPLFLRGDSTGSGTLDISDCIADLEFLFLGRGVLDCLDATDSNDDGALDIGDPLFLLFHLFEVGKTPPAPYPEPGPDPTPDYLGCARG